MPDSAVKIESVSILDASVRPESLLLSDAQAAQLIGIGRRTFRRHDAAGKPPQAVKVGGLTRWRRSDIVQWIELGLPPREKYEQLKEARQG